MVLPIGKIARSALRISREDKNRKEVGYIALPIHDCTNKPLVRLLHEGPDKLIMREQAALPEYCNQKYNCQLI